MVMDAEGAQDPGTNPLAGYNPPAGGYDELLSPDGHVREHWRPLIGLLRALPAEQQAQRAQRLDRLVTEFGIAHDVFADPKHETEPWKVDLMPLIIAPQEWRWIERALGQRARLMDAVLRDLYGRQDLLRSGQIPPHLVFADPNFLRPCVGGVTKSRYLSFYAADVVRANDGRWWVVDNHTRSLAGAGFALANRIVHAHVARDLFDASNIYRLAPYFHKLQAELLHRGGADEPLIVMLTPGSLHDEYFGQAYLARYLGIMLVEGGDLRVIGERVFMKTLEGLRPVSLIVRSVQGALSDPLELDPTGFLGPVGLMQAVRAQPDLVINDLGTEVAENRALGAYFPALCEHLLGEQLELHDAPRWWLGDAQARDHVLANLDDFVLRPAQAETGRPGQTQPGIIAAELEPEDRQRLVHEIGLNGKSMVAQKAVDLATAPVWSGEGLRPAPYAVRFFVAAMEDGYQVMPGGIAFSLSSGRGVSLCAPEGLSRDVWVQSEGEVPKTPSLLLQTAEVRQVQRTGRGLRSRIADNLFWLGRYTERADWMLRLMRTALARLEEDGGPNREYASVRRALTMILAKGQPQVDVAAGASAPAIVERLVRTLASSPGYPFGLRRTVENVHRLANQIRDRLSVEAWRTLQHFSGGGWPGANLPASASDTQDFFDLGISTLAAFNGLVAENMTRDHGWRFLDMGRRLERATNLAELLSALFATAQEESEESAALLFTLEVADSIITYRSRYLFAPALPLVLDLLLIDEINPRGMAFQLAAISEHLGALPQASEGSVQAEEERMILDLLTQVRLADPEALGKVDHSGSRTQFQALFGHLNKGLPKLSEAITQRYFNLKEDEVRRVLSYTERRQ